MRYDKNVRYFDLHFVIFKLTTITDNIFIEIITIITKINLIYSFRFRRREKEKDYIRIRKGFGCSSGIGRWGRGVQNITLGPKCNDRGTILHELMHVIGNFFLYSTYSFNTRSIEFYAESKAKEFLKKTK